MPIESTSYTTTQTNLTSSSCCKLPRSCLILLAQAILLISSIAFGIFYAYNAAQTPNLLIKGAALIAPTILCAIIIALSVSLLILYLTVKRFKQHTWSLRSIEMLALIAFAITSTFLAYATYVTSHAIAITGLVLSLLSLPILALMAYIHCRKNTNRSSEYPITETPEPIYVNLNIQGLGQQTAAEPIYVNLEPQVLERQPTAEQAEGYNALILAASQEHTTRSCCPIKSSTCNLMKCNTGITILISLAFIYVVSSVATLFAFDKLIGTALIAFQTASGTAAMLLLVALITSIMYITCKRSCKYITSSIVLITLATFTMLAVSISALVVAAEKYVFILSLVGAAMSLIFLGISLTIAIINCRKLKNNNPTRNLNNLLQLDHRLRNDPIYVTMPMMPVHTGSDEHIYESVPIGESYMMETQI